MITKMKALIDNQYGKPRGLLGMYFGEKMVRQHKPETLWTIELLRNIEDKSVLELGCGAGYAMKHILSRDNVKEAVGIDLSPVLIRSAAMRNKKAVIEGRAKLVEGDVKQLPFQSEHFNKVFSIHSIYFWDQLPDTVSEIHRVLKPGGSFIITLSDGKDDEKWEGIESLMKDKFIPLARERGFHNVELVRGPHSRHYHTAAILGEKRL
ncbi:class I SAM-dependent methyltransferase [Halobacillus sp. Marseille-Q1614]|uniref:class I SAM-dependent methyltransferase n=1 Tax=Halobacillus sp. Marseille-Q1614 TaxID=2709134 RepID=UPI00156DB914|nr:class I SAM-dependent methyltransferase [Halobacillus sp. Marseille-Q1614]